MPFCPKKGQKGAKVGGAVGKIQLFCILFKIGSLDFFHILQFFRKILIFSKMGKRAQNCPKIVFFLLLCKIESLVFARNGLKWSVLWLTDFMRKCYIWENSYSRDLYAKALDQSDRSIFQITISFEPFYRFLYFFAYR